MDTATNDYRQRAHEGCIAIVLVVERTNEEEEDEASKGDCEKCGWEIEE